MLLKGGARAGRGAAVWKHLEAGTSLVRQGIVPAGGAEGGVTEHPEGSPSVLCHQ